MDSAAGLRGSTRMDLYRQVRDEGPLTKNEISQSLGISIPTATKYLKSLIADGLIRRGPKLSSGPNGGRNPVAYTLAPLGRIAVGVDITRDTFTCAVVNLDRQVLSSRLCEYPYRRSSEYFSRVATEVEALLESLPEADCQILGVGIAVPGLVSEATGQVSYGRVIDIEGLAAADFGQYLPYPTRLVHDSNAAGLAEFGIDDEDQNLFYISLSRSIGGAVRVDRNMYRGDGEFAGEIGHMKIHPGGELCYCGKPGCADPYCNATVLSRHTGGSLTSFFAALAQEDDPALAQVWETYTSDLALVIHNVRVLFGGRVILGGDVGAHIRSRLAPLCHKIDQLSFLESSAASYLSASKHSNDPVAFGAALRIIEEFNHDLSALA